MTEHLVAEYDVLRAIYKRRAVRAYRPEDVPADTISELLAAAVQAPSAMHREPWGFVVVQDRAQLKRYSDRGKALMREDELTVGWGSSPSHHHDYPAMLKDPAFNMFYDAGTLIVVCRRMGGTFADADCWLAAQNLMLEATAKGLGTCCIGLAVPVLNLHDVKRELGIPEQGAAIAPVIVGFPRGDTPPVARQPPHVLRWIK
jgi:nitroreductase